MAMSDQFVGGAAEPIDLGQLEGRIRSLRDELAAGQDPAAQTLLVEFLLQLGQYRRATGDPDEAALALLEAVGFDLGSQSALTELAGALCDLDYPDEALNFLQRAASNSPADVGHGAMKSRALYAV